MSTGAFTDRNRKPTDAEIAKVIGRMAQSWHALIRHIRATFQPHEEFKFCYGKKYGWALQFRAKGALLATLYPSSDGFTAQIILSSAALERTTGLKLGESARQAIAKAKPYPEGKWLFVPVHSERELQDVQNLLALKMEAASRKKAASA